MSTDTRISTPPAATEPCPSPLSWGDVLSKIRAEAPSWTLSRGIYSVAGRTLGTGLPLVFLGGATHTSELFALLAWLLKDEFRCILVEYPDHTARNTDRRPLSIEDYSDDLIAVIDAQCGEPAAAYAVSFGVPVLATAMQRSPRHFRRAIFQDAQVRLPLTWTERLVVAGAQYIPGRFRHVPGRSTVWRQNHGAWFPPFDFSRWNFFFDATGSVTIKTLARRVTLMQRTDLAGVLPLLDTPALIVGTEGSGPRLAARRQEFADLLPNACTELLDTTGLVPFLTHPHRLKKVIQPFLQDTTFNATT